MTILETQRFILRKITLDDAPFVLEILNDPSFIANIGDRNVRTLEDAKNYIQERMFKSYQDFGFGMWAVVVKSEKIIAGMAGLVKRPTLEDIDIGFAFLPAFFGKGFATECALGVRDYAKNKLKMKRLVGITSPHNTASMNVLKKIGMTYEKDVEVVPKDIVKLFGMNL